MMQENIPLLLIFLTLGLFIYFNIQVVVDFAGRYIYPLDDAYIHLSMARNFAEFQTWGITQYEFSSTTSSPLFTFLLALIIKILFCYLLRDSRNEPKQSHPIALKC